MHTLAGALPRNQHHTGRASRRPISLSHAFGSDGGRTHTLDERNLLQACKQGDLAAWNELVGRYERSVYKFAYSLSGNYDDAGDIAGQVFVRVFENLHTFRHDAHFTSWLFCIVRNVYVDTCIRAPHRSHLSLDESVEFAGEQMVRELVDSAPSPEQRAIDSERGLVLRRAIRHLPSYQRLMMEMYLGDGLSYEEISTRTGLSLGTVKSRLSRARHTLRERLESFREVLLPA